MNNYCERHDKILEPEDEVCPDCLYEHELEIRDEIRMQATAAERARCAAVCHDVAHGEMWDYRTAYECRLRILSGSQPLKEADDE